MERIGFVGLGTMGAAMAANVRKAGFEVSIDFGDDQAPKSHVRTLHPYVGPAMA